MKSQIKDLGQCQYEDDVLSDNSVLASSTTDENVYGIIEENDFNSYIEEYE